MSDGGGWAGLVVLGFFLVVGIGVAALISWAIGKNAVRKNRSFWAFFLVSFLFFPLGAVIMGIIVATLAPPEPTTNLPGPLAS